MNESPAPSDAPPDLVDQLAAYLAGGATRFVVVSAKVGGGKSTLLQTLFPKIAGAKILLLYQQMGVPNAASGAMAPTSLLVAMPGLSTAEPAEEERDGFSLAAGPAAGLGSGIEVPPALARAVARLEASSGGTVVADSWDRSSETFARTAVANPGSIETFSLPAAEFGSVQSSLLSMKVNLVLGTVPELGAPLQSLADGLVELREETVHGARVRIASLPKMRGIPPLEREHLYSLSGGRFRSFPDLASGIQPPAVGPEPDPSPDARSIWPGSSAFAGAFGRLRIGGLTALSLAPGNSDAYLTAIMVPLVAHVLRTAGRVVWMPPPSVRPSQVVRLLTDHVSADWLRERLRVLSASGDDPSLGELRSVVLPLRRELAGGTELKAATSPGVGPIFPDAHRFLSMAPESGAALYVMSLEGLRATAATANLPLNAVTMPSVIAAYARLPRFHGIGYGQADDPIAAALLPNVTTALFMQVLCGRTVVHGERPRTPAYVMDWPDPDGKYTLVPCG